MPDSSGVWTSSEIDNQQHLGYGTYRWVVGTDLSTIDANAVLGMFTYGGNAPSNNEIDIEASHWGNMSWPTGSGTVWQDAAANLSEEKDFSYSSNPPYVNQFIWSPGEIQYLITDATGATLLNWTVTSGVPTPSTEVPVINFWRYNDVPPASAQTMRILSFAWAPPGQTLSGPGSGGGTSGPGSGGTGSGSTSTTTTPTTTTTTTTTSPASTTPPATAPVSTSTASTPPAPSTPAATTPGPVAPGATTPVKTTPAPSGTSPAAGPGSASSSAPAGSPRAGGGRPVWTCAVAGARGRSGAPGDVSLWWPHRKVVLTRRHRRALIVWRSDARVRLRLVVDRLAHRRWHVVGRFERLLHAGDGRLWLPAMLHGHRLLPGAYAVSPASARCSAVELRFSVV